MLHNQMLFLGACSVLKIEGVITDPETIHVAVQTAERVWEEIIRLEQMREAQSL